MKQVRNILAIRFARLGDVILLLPALSAIKASLPHARLTLLTGHRCAPIGEMCPAVDEVICVDRLAMRDGSVWRAMRDVKQLAADIRKREFDTVIDFHSFRETNLLTWFSRAPIRVGMRRYNAPYLSFCFNRPAVNEDKTLHVSEMFRRVAEALPGVDSSSRSSAAIRVPESDRLWIEREIPRRPRLSLYVDAPVDDRRWPPEYFAAVADYAVESMQAQPIVLASPGNEAVLTRVLAASRKATELRVFPGLPLPRLAAAIGSSTLLISNDTGPMHLGPALGVRTLGLFSVGLPEHFRPIGKGDGYLKAVPIDRISVKQVIEEVGRMWTKTVDRDLPR